jgi:hypothetical protein
MGLPRGSGLPPVTALMASAKRYTPTSANAKTA